MEKNKFILRTSGFTLYFFLFITLILAFILFSLLKNISQHGLDLVKILLFIFFVWFLFFIYRLIFGQKIEINDNQLSISSSFTNKFVLFPKINVQRINLQEISIVTIARRKYFEEHAQEFRDKGLENLIEAYRNLFSVSIVGSIVVPFPLGDATAFTPLLFVVPKDKSQNGLAITAEFFSKNGFKNLIGELQKRNVPVFTEPTLGLMPNDPSFLHNRANKNVVVGLSSAVVSIIIFFIFIGIAIKDNIPSNSAAVLIFLGSLLGLAISFLAYGFTGKIKSTLKVTAIWIFIIVALLIFSFIK